MFAILLSILFLQSPSLQDPLESEPVKIYEKGLKLYFAENPTKKTDSLAMAYFNRLLTADSLAQVLTREQLLNVHEKLGNLYLMAEADQKAIASYRKAISMNRFPALEDSLFFSANLFLGEAYYKQSKPDSAIHFLKRAEHILDLKKSRNEGSRLFNSMGVYYYETGNFSQSINYFTKAKDLVIGARKATKLDTYYQYAFYSFTSNIATALVRLNQLDSAERMFKDLLELEINPEKIHLALVDLYLEKGSPDEAGKFLNKISTQNTISSIGYANQLAEIHFQKRNFEKAEEGLRKLIASYQADKTDFLEGNRNFKLGFSHQLLGKVLLEQQQYQNALHHFQYAILHFDPGFSDLNPLTNPNDHGMGFAAYSLFETLILKANALLSLADKDNQHTFWQAAIDTYNEAFNKVFYLNAFYDNDQARIFLGESILPAYQRAVDQVLSAYRQNTHQKELLEQAFLWAEGSKSISLLARQQEGQLKAEIGIPETLLEKERRLNFEMANLIQKINDSEDSMMSKTLQQKLLDIRLARSRLHHEFNDIPEYLLAKSRSRIESLQELQENLLSEGILLVSLFETDTELHLFYVNKNSLEIESLPINKTLKEKVMNVKLALLNAEWGENFQQRVLSQEIFREVFASKWDKINAYEELLIIPHGIWRDFPFDILVDHAGNYLIENLAIGYQFSAHFMDGSAMQLPGLENTLAMAPYTHGTGNEQFVELPYSLEEIESLPGNKLVGKEATKSRFLAAMGDHSILHLATHAQAFLENPYRSFVAFYPDSTDFRLYLEELQYKRFEKTALVYLSACETNYGQVSASEGVLGISRAFAYAGCPNIITSLWKMEDMVSAFISARFYHHLDNGYTVAKSLQLAKTDLLVAPEMSQFRHPKYWAPLVYIGNPVGLEKNFSWKYIIIFACLLTGYLVIRVFNQKTLPLVKGG
ncbi:Tetratricopeptide repeat-containing protein [Cyclobacterium lianum]|uniref:Tetratricopeptide repeat-containing protein n=1 Tax=Cyclobacterium lianum TaxID=388280 RepID=A0A1M7NTY1_9BACT|nr:CHAT domain-containing protein [Cyclobacterium lianum]SHN07534.1 Tetratricopeptide repeat-containing protein [Cyclobacterium lianum]